LPRTYLLKFAVPLPDATIRLQVDGTVSGQCFRSRIS
jgi:hypothetical protein